MGQYISSNAKTMIACPIAELLCAGRRRMFNIVDAFSVATISFSIGYILGKLY